MSGESLMGHHLGSVSAVRDSRAYRSIARIAIAGQLLTMLPAAATPSAAQGSMASLATASAARAAQDAEQKLIELLPPGALLSDAHADEASAPTSRVRFTPGLGYADFEAMFADRLLGADQRGTTRPGDRQDGPVPPVPEPKRVIVNRTVPRVTPRPTAPTLSAAPADREFFDARIFPEPLVPMGATTGDDNRALGEVLRQYVAERNRENVSPVLAHLQRFPASPWRASLLANIGTVFSQHGYYGRAFESWNAAWQLSKGATDPRVRAVADYAIAEWLGLMTRFGDVPALDAKLRELEGRKLTGSTSARINLAREALWVLKNHHEWATPSARAAIASWLYVRSPAYARERARAKMSPAAAMMAERSRGAAALGAADPDRASALRMPEALTTFHARPEGTSLRELTNLATAAGLRVRSAYRPGDAALVTPAIAHLKPGHYTLVVRQEEGRVLLRDAILGGEMWMSRAALDEESSGYWLIDDGPLPNGWRDVQVHEANVIIGRCAPGVPGDIDPGCPCRNGGGGPGGGGPGGPGSGGGGGGCANPGSCPPSPGMPTYFFHPVSAALRLVDTPVGYAPPRGPAAFFTLSYHQRETTQPAIFTYSNLGPKWTFDWLSYVQEHPTACAQPGPCVNAHTSLFLRGSGLEDYGRPDVNGAYEANFRSRAVLVKVSDSPVRYERRLPDGSIDVFTQPDGAASGERRIFLTSVVDPQGQSMQLTYDVQLRIVAFTDALGQVTTVSYEHPSDPLKITKVTDPFGRFATFTYTPAGQLASITDVIGLTSSFRYATDDFIAALTTPYGTTTFRHETTPGYPRVIEATDPLGGTEHLEYHFYNESLADAEPAAVVPTGFSALNEHLQYYTTFYWSKRQWALHPRDITKATQTQWLLFDLVPDDASHGMASSIPRSIKQPLENRVWYAYPDQNASTRWVGSWVEPERVGRVLDDGTSQIEETTYNTNGQPLTETDPLGRRASYTYAANGIDLLDIRQTTGVLNDVLATYSNYTSQHKPQTATDAAGEEATIAYNAEGQPLTITNPKNETLTYGYDSNGYVQSLTLPMTGATSALTYDGYGRIHSTTDSDGRTVTRQYDALDRVTRLTYPDGTYEEMAYDRLDMVGRRDRLGRWTRYGYDALRRPVTTRDPLGRTIMQQWCACGSLDSLTDAKGQRTRWEYDIQGRRTREIRADEVKTVVYTYESATSRLKTVIDPKLQVATYHYNIDDTLASMVFTNSTVATPTVSFAYDPSYLRRTSMTDGTGTTSYTYHPVGVMGAGSLATIDGSLTNDTITYAYDELGRVATRSINSVTSTLSYDSLGRLESEVNPLGTFTYTFQAQSNRMASVSYPNGQLTQFSYFGVSNDLRLQTIHHKRSNTSTLSKYDFTYDASGNIITSQHQTDNAAPTVWRYEYDPADQLVSAVNSTTAVPGSVLSRYAYSYDSAGNRVGEQLGDDPSKATYDVLNRLIQQSPGGELRVKGTVNEPASATIQGRPAIVDAANSFSGTATVTSESTTVAIVATDSSGNTASGNYQLTASGVTRSYTYDANGNLTSDGTRTFEWDARDQLVAVSVGTHRSEFTYDGMRRRVRIVELESSVIQSEATFVWCQTAVCEERAANGVTVTRQHFALGEMAAGTERFYVSDRLGSVTEVTDDAGALLARYAFDPWGRRTLTSGTDVATLGYAGQRWHSFSELSLTMYRGYDPQAARWISEDPAGFADGPNLYSYALNQPVRRIDPLGDTSKCCSCTVQVKCRAVKDLPPGISADHCYVVARDSQCETWYFESGPDPKTNQNYASSSTVLHKSNAEAPITTPGWPRKSDCKVVACMVQAVRNWNDAKITYHFLGPNSNSFASWILRECGAKNGRPVGGDRTPGWY